MAEQVGVACRSSSTAGRGESAADRLTQQGPWQHSQGHLLHMASHTFVRLGRYHDGVLSNVRAFRADLDDSEHCRRPYLPEHNLEMLIYAATSGGEVCPCYPIPMPPPLLARLCLTYSASLRHAQVFRHLYHQQKQSLSVKNFVLTR